MATRKKRVEEEQNDANDAMIMGMLMEQGEEEDDAALHLEDGHALPAISQADIIQRQAATIATLNDKVEKAKDYKQLTKAKLKEAAQRLREYRLRVEALMKEGESLKKKKNPPTNSHVAAKTVTKRSIATQTMVKQTSLREISTQTSTRSTMKANVKNSCTQTDVDARFRDVATREMASQTVKDSKEAKKTKTSGVQTTIRGEIRPVMRGRSRSVQTDRVTMETNAMQRHTQTEAPVARKRKRSLDLAVIEERPSPPMPASLNGKIVKVDRQEEKAAGTGETKPAAANVVTTVQATKETKSNDEEAKRSFDAIADAIDAELAFSSSEDEVMDVSPDHTAADSSESAVQTTTATALAFDDEMSALIDKELEFSSSSSDDSSSDDEEENDKQEPEELIPAETKTWVAAQPLLDPAIAKAIDEELDFSSDEVDTEPPVKAQDAVTTSPIKHMVNETATTTAPATEVPTSSQSVLHDALAEAIEAELASSEDDMEKETDTKQQTPVVLDDAISAAIDDELASSSDEEDAEEKTSKKPDATVTNGFMHQLMRASSSQATTAPTESQPSSNKIDFDVALSLSSSSSSADDSEIDDEDTSAAVPATAMESTSTLVMQKTEEANATKTAEVTSLPVEKKQPERSVQSQQDKVANFRQSQQEISKPSEPLNPEKSSDQDRPSERQQIPQHESPSQQKDDATFAPKENGEKKQDSVTTKAPTSRKRTLSTDNEPQVSKKQRVKTPTTTAASTTEKEVEATNHQQLPPISHQHPPPVRLNSAETKQESPVKPSKPSSKPSAALARGLIAFQKIIARQVGEKCDDAFVMRGLSALVKASASFVRQSDLESQAHVQKLCGILTKEFKSHCVSLLTFVRGALRMFRTPRTRHLVENEVVVLSRLCFEVFNGLHSQKQEEQGPSIEMTECLAELRNTIIASRLSRTQAASGSDAEAIKIQLQLATTRGSRKNVISHDKAYLGHVMAMLAQICAAHDHWGRAYARVLLFDVLRSSPNIKGLFLTRIVLQIAPQVLCRDDMTTSLLQDTMRHVLPVIAAISSAKREMLQEQSALMMLSGIGDALNDRMLGGDLMTTNGWEHAHEQTMVTTVWERIEAYENHQVFELAKSLELLAAVYGEWWIDEFFSFAQWQHMATKQPKRLVVELVGRVAIALQQNQLAESKKPPTSRFVKQTIDWLQSLVQQKEEEARCVRILVELALVLPLDLSLRQQCLATVSRWIQSQSQTQLMQSTMSNKLLRQLKYAIVTTRPYAIQKNHKQREV